MANLAIATLCLAVIGVGPASAGTNDPIVGTRAPEPAVVNLADTDPKPVLLSSVRPVYPPDLRGAGIEGNAVVDFILDPTVIPTRVQIARQTNAAFGAAAAASVAQWRFSPGGKNGAKVWVHLQIPIVFSINPTDAAHGANLPPMPDVAPGEAVFDISKVSSRPSAAFQSRPQFPAALRSSGTSGQTLIAFIVRTNGRTSNVTVVSATDPLFGAAGVDAVRRWRFHPARIGGEAVNCRLEVPLVFSLSH
jgi:TonB family protein